MSSLKLKGLGRDGLALVVALGAASALAPAPVLANSAASTRGGGGGSSSGHASGSASHSSSGSSHSSSGSSSSGHGGGSSGVAVPRGSGSSPGGRSPHHSYSSGHDGHDGHYHGGGYWGGYWGGYYPWYGYGWGPYYGWGWGAGWWWPWAASIGYYGGPPAYDGYYGYGGDGGYGALDLDVVPESAQVFVDGQYAGTCDDFDGYPQYLWLPAGTHDVAIYSEGHVTIGRQYSIYGGRVIAVNDHMQAGQAVRPEELQPSISHERRDDRLRRNEEREQDARQWDPNWRERDPGLKPEEELTPRERREERDIERQAAASAPQARVHLLVAPDDASVYLDGTFIGTGSQIGHVNGMVVPAGHHVVDVVRPGFDPEHVEFDSTLGQEVEVKVVLDKD
jgi:hypothetical protein